ncbi:hypothetical protein CVT26_000193 [Gymnopilus dilepis]|uniref:Protein kinase domain-containing protein n=1 Tax=Gymnopilus dilepis TaxID=231916 RepID=A0A409VG36_9AGAR|nr:hypothetical protein CVT26_000193 [Gymnopilus dilepis]
MPPGVIHAFKSLIRHGKQHPPHEDPSSSRGLRHDRDNIPPPQNRQQVAEQIVDEERKAKSKMTTYKGLENFRLDEKMGDGAFSNVYRAVDLTSGKPVAIIYHYTNTLFFYFMIPLNRRAVLFLELQAGEKHLNPQFKKKPRVTEVQIMRGTNHPSIVKLFSFSESPEHYFLVMELMEGGELFHQIVKLTYFSENLSRHVILQVASAIRYLHEERGVVHRDIKPENLLFERIPIIPSKNPIRRPYDEEKEDEGEFIPGVGGGGIGRVKIADFGLSKVVWNEQTMTPCGTVGYTAPEIVKDERYSKSVDMWALGCVLYTLLCGFPPFYDESINVLTEKVARGYYTFLSPWWDDISHSAKDLISHLLCVDPAQRYTIDEFLAHPWCKEAPAPPPPATPFIYGNREPYSGRPLDSPLLSEARGGRGFEGRSPGIATLKEAFDITYAVHRMEEEGARRRKYNGRGGAGTRGFLTNLNEDDEEEEYDSDEHSGDDQQPPAQPQQQRNSVLDGRAGPRDQGRNAAAAGANGTSRTGGTQARSKNPRTFELDLDNATLLGRRQHGKRVPGVGASSPLRMEGLRMDDNPPEGSPMRL